MTDNSSSQVLNEFLGEAEEIIEKLNVDLVTLGDSADAGEGDPDLLNGIFRGAHSLKGLAGMFGFDDVSSLAHHMEGLLDSLRLGKVPLDTPLVETLFDALEIITRLVHGKGEGDGFTLDLKPILDQISGILSGSGQAAGNQLENLNIDQEILSVLTEYEEHRLLDNIQKGRTLFKVKASFDLTSFDQDLAEINHILKQHGEVVSTLPCSGDVSDRIAFQLLFGTNADVETIQKALGRDDVVIETVGQAGSAPVVQAAPVVSAPSGEAREVAPPAVETSVRSISRTVRVDIEKLDSLMNIVGELVLAKSSIAGLCEQLKEEYEGELASSMIKATRILERRLHELQSGVMDVRMVPVGQLFEKMNRIVRRVASETEKKVNLDLRGADTELDKLIIEDLSDPLMHIIRNAIDHGLESTAERRAAGKPEKGTICLWASQKGNNVVIEVRDDGRGIDPEKVRHKAVERGLISEGVELSREEVFELVFMAGFSTRDQVTDLSGRGVGMDVVKNNIAMLSGVIEMDSQVGQGTSLAITLPITLAIIKALVVRVCGKTYAIPINSVMETLMLNPADIHTIERREVIELRQSTLPLLWLDRTFGLPAGERKEDKFFVAVVGLAEKRMGIVVDELLGQQDVVIKSLGSTLSFVKGIAGAADLGNQKTILVLDVGGLMGEAFRGESSLYV